MNLSDFEKNENRALLLLRYPAIRPINYLGRDKATNKVPMPQNVFDSQVVELTPETSGRTCVIFDPENVRLEGGYKDQISAYRAKRIWVEALERCFLLDMGHDFQISVASNIAESHFVLRC